MGQVGERVLQKGISAMAEEEVRRKTESIRTLEVGTSMM